METIIINRLKSIWHNEFSSCGLNQDLINKLFKFINIKYNEPHRHYHKPYTY